MILEAHSRSPAHDCNCPCPFIGCGGFCSQDVGHGNTHSHLIPNHQWECTHQFKNLYWVPDWRDIEKEWAKLEDVQREVFRLAQVPADKKGVRIMEGFAYKGTEKYLRRMPIGIYQSRKRWGKPKGYWETRDAVKKQ